MSAAGPSPGTRAAEPESQVRYWGLLAAIAALIVVCALPAPQDLPVAGQYMLGMLLFSVILWMTEAVDYPNSAVLISSLVLLLGATYWKWMGYLSK